MRVSLFKDSESNPSGILVHVEVSEIDSPPKFIYSHSFKYNVPSGNDGEIIVYNDKTTASDNLDGTRYSFALEKKCRNKDCKKENPDGCPVIAGRTDRLLVADVFHTQPTQDSLGYFGTALFKAIFSGDAKRLLENTEPMHPNGRIFLQLNKHDDLDAIPWEYAKDSPTSFLVHQRRFARIHDHPQDPLPKLPLRIVAVAPDPVIPPNEPGANLSDLHLSEQFNNFKDGFARNNKKVKLERVFPPTVSQMGALLDTNTTVSTVLHFMGHCGQDRENDSRALIFEHGATGMMEYINASQLVSVSKNLRLAFLSACDSREVARILVKHGVRYTIGSDCPIPDDLARKFEFEFYKFLANGHTLEMAMYQARVSFQVNGDIRQSDYFAGAIVLYLSTVDEDDGAFQCDEGAPDIDIHEPKHNLTELHTASVFHGRKKELAELYSHLRNMVLKGQNCHIYTIKCIDDQGFVAEAMRRMAHLFPGGIFAWAFDKEITSPNDYFRRLVKVIFSEDICVRLTEQYSSDVDEFGSAIIEQFRTGNHATCLLILDHADILNLGRKEQNMHAEKLGNWLENVVSVQDTVKILLTSKEPVDWLKGGLMDLDNSNDIGSGRQGHTSTETTKKSVHQYFAQTKEPIYFYGVPAENLAFVKRSDILANMEAMLGACRTLALSGLGGMGKTQLILRYCYLHRAAYDYIFWLEVDNWAVAIESFRKLAIKLGIDEESTKGEEAEKKVVDWVCAWLQERTHWLLLLNNCDGDDMEKKVFELLPHIGGGNIILTTRLYISSKKAAVIHVDKLQEEEALFLLLDISSIDSIDKESTKFRYAQEIIVKLDYMPLAIALACAYIKDTGTSLQRYLSMLQEEKKRSKLFKYDDDNDDYKYSVATVWQLSFERIRVLSPIAVQILEACAFLHPENIPVHLFTQQYTDLQLSSVSEHDDEQSFDDIEAAIAVLAKFSFVIKTYNEVGDDGEDPASDLLTIHRLVQKVIYDTMGNEQIQRWAYSIPKALTSEIDFSDTYAVHTRRAMNSYLAHICYFATLLNDFGQQSMISKDLVDLLNKTIDHLSSNGMYFSMANAVELSVRFSEMIYGLEDPSTATSLNSLADLYENQGKYGKAELLYQRALAIREKVLGSEHADTATSLNNLASLYQDQGKYDEAEPLYQRALTIREKVLGSEHPDTAASLNNLALLYQDQGKYGEAEPLYQRDLAISEKVLGSEHPDTATSLSNLASLYRDQGKYDEAEPLFQRVLTIREKVLGSEHPDTATSLSNLASLYFDQGKDSEAEPLYQRDLAISEKVLGSEHPDTAASLSNLARLYQDQGNYNEAEPLFQRALTIREKVLGSEHPYTATSLSNLASLYQDQGKYSEAEPLYQRNLAINEKVLGSEHPDTAASLNNLARLYQDQGNYNEAEPLYQRALTIREKVLGSEHPYTATSLSNLASLYQYQGKYSEAEPLFQRDLAISEKVLGSEHPDTAASLNNLALLYLDQGKYNEAEPLFQRALTIREKVSGSEHPETATSLDNLARLYQNQGKYDEAEPIYQRALAIRKKVLGSEHPDTIATLKNMTDLCNNRGRNNEATDSAQFGHQDNIAAQSETDIKISDGARDGTVAYDLGTRDADTLLLEKGEESPKELAPSSGDGGSSSESQKKEPQRWSDNDGIIWKTTAVVASVGAVICIAWLLWGQMKPRRRLQR